MAQAESVPSAIRAPITGATSNPSTAHGSAGRRYFIGGSDARIIMGDDEAALQRLWRENRGKVEPEDLSGNLVVQLGHATEPLNRHWYERDTGQVLTGVRATCNIHWLRLEPQNLHRRHQGSDKRGGKRRVRGCVALVTALARKHRQPHGPRNRLGERARECDLR